MYLHTETSNLYISITVISINMYNLDEFVMPNNN